MTPVLPKESEAPAASREDVAPVQQNGAGLREIKQELLDQIRAALDSLYSKGVVTISISDIPAFGTTSQCLESLSGMSREEVERIHRILTVKP